MLGSKPVQGTEQASGVWGTGTVWPDLIVAGTMASLFLWSSAQIVRQGRQELALALSLPPEKGCAVSLAVDARQGAAEGEA